MVHNIPRAARHPHLIGVVRPSDLLVTMEATRRMLWGAGTGAVAWAAGTVGAGTVGAGTVGAGTVGAGTVGAGSLGAGFMGAGFAGAGWWLVVVAAAIAACVALLDAPGLVVAAAGAAVATGRAQPPGQAVAVGVAVLAAGALLGPLSRRLTARSGPLPLDAVLVACTLAVLAVGPPGALLAPAGVAVVQAMLPAPAGGRSDP